MISLNNKIDHLVCQLAIEALPKISLPFLFTYSTSNIFPSTLSLLLVIVFISLNPMATFSLSNLTKTLSINIQSHPKTPTYLPSLPNSFPSATPSFLPCTLPIQRATHLSRIPLVKAASDNNDFSARRSNSNSNEPRETIMLPGCDYNHWLIVMEFPKDPAPTREQMIDTYLQTLATVLGR